MTLKFFYNGLKASDGKLQRAHYTKGNYTNLPEGTITIYKTVAHGDYSFSNEVRKIFHVINETDIMTDYFEEDKIRVFPSHHLYNAVLEAWNKQTARWELKRAA